MSQASSAFETRSIRFEGEDMTVEQALQKVVKATQSALNNIEINLRHLAILDDQHLDDNEDFQMAVGYEDAIVDFIEDAEDNMDELPGIAAEIRGPCPPESKEWWAKHKEARKAKRVAEKEKKKQELAAARAKEKELKIASKAK